MSTYRGRGGVLAHNAKVRAFRDVAGAQGREGEVLFALAGRRPTGAALGAMFLPAGASAGDGVDAVTMGTGICRMSGT